MEKFADGVVRHKKAVTVFFVVLAALCALLTLGVDVNYNMVDYLPESAQSTQAVKIMGEEFEGSIPNARVMVRDVSVAQALEYKEALLAIDGISDVMWLDTMLDTATPLEVADTATVESYYKDSTALFQVTVEDGTEVATINAIRDLVGENGAVSGDAADTATMQLTATQEILQIVAFMLPIIILLLIISTSSWLEPVLFLLAIGVSVLINMGTNIFLGSVSFVTNSVSPILQMAVSMDYAIFLLHSFKDYRAKYGDAEVAMKKAMKKSITSISASATTTLFGFLALVFMQFTIGADLGLNLAKGIVLSFLSVVIFMPAVTLFIYKWIDKTSHRPFMPKFRNIGKVFSKVKYPALILGIVLIVPAFLGQRQVDFQYGYSALSEGGDQSAVETQAIRDAFGESNMIVVLVPKGDTGREEQLADDLSALNHVTSVMSYTATVDAAIPSNFLSESITSQFYSGHYARIILTTDTATEGDTAFALVEEVNATAERYYPGAWYSCGQSVNLYDMSEVVAVDNDRVNLLAIVAIFLVLLVTFRSIPLPFILIVTIELGIWINLSLPYFTGSSLNFIGYLVLSTVQLGATVDYAILFTDHYMANRKRMRIKDALHKTMGECFQSILVSASILAIAGFTLMLISSQPIVAEIGLLLGRGTLLSLLMVVCVLPALLTIFDPVIGKLTMRANFFQKKKTPVENKEKDNETQMV